MGEMQTAIWRHDPPYPTYPGNKRMWDREESNGGSTGSDSPLASEGGGGGSEGGGGGSEEGGGGSEGGGGGGAWPHAGSEGGGAWPHAGSEGGGGGDAWPHARPSALTPSHHPPAGRTQSPSHPRWAERAGDPSHHPPAARGQDVYHHRHSDSGSSDVGREGWMGSASNNGMRAAANKGAANEGQAAPPIEPVFFLLLYYFRPRDD